MKVWLPFFAAVAWPSVALAAEVSVPVHLIDAAGVGAQIGTVTFADGPDGLIIKPELAGLPSGPHGFHVHENPSCDTAEKDGQKVAGLAAGGHYDPQKTGKHLGPQGEGHLGDLPALDVGSDGRADAAMTAPRLAVADLKGRAVVIHGGGDNYSDQPAALGGGGARIACGIIE